MANETLGVDPSQTVCRHVARDRVVIETAWVASGLRKLFVWPLPWQHVACVLCVCVCVCVGVGMCVGGECVCVCVCVSEQSNTSLPVLSIPAST